MGAERGRSRDVKVRMILIIAFILLFAARASADSHPGPDSVLMLGNGTAELTLGKSPSWHIASVRFPAAGFAAAPAEPIPLYQLDWYEKGSLETFTSFQATQAEARKLQDTVILGFFHEKQKLRIECRVWAASDGLHWDAAFHNESRTGRPAVFRYPGIAIPAAAGRLDAVISVADGLRIRDVFAKLGENDFREWQYPGMLSSQMTAWMGKTGGAVLYAADSSGYLKTFKVTRYYDHIVPAFGHVLIGYKQANFGIPYHTVLAPFRGGWEAAADVYRDWAIRQPWCRKTLKERRPPAATAQPVFFLCDHIRLDRGKSVSDESPVIPRIGQDYRNALGLPIVNLFYSWEKHGPWVAPDYFPPYPGREAFERMTRAIHARGDETMVYLSGLNVTLEKTPRHGAPAYRLPDSLRKALEPSAIVGRDLRTVVQGKAEEGVGRKWVLCPATTAAKTQILDGVRKALDLGVDLVQIDQVVGGGTPPCFQEAHGHPWAGLDKLTKGFAAILSEAHQLTYGKGAALSLEEPGEYFIPYLDIVHTREYAEGYWPREGRGVEGVPLFSYLYHDYQLGYGGEAQLLRGPENAGAAVYSQAVELMAGRFPAGALWMQIPEYGQVDPELKRVLGEIAAIWRSEARDFLMMGQARGLPYSFPEHPISFDVKGDRHSFDVPVFLSKSYRLGDREIALFINTTLADQPLDPAPLRGPGNLEAIWPPDRAGKPLDISKPLTVPGHGILILRRGS